MLLLWFEGETKQGGGQKGTGVIVGEDSAADAGLNNGTKSNKQV
jgi:hypothetical protein